MKILVTRGAGFIGSQGPPFPVVGGGTQSRDFTHVYDTVRALISLLEPKVQFNGTYEIGTGI